MPTRSRGSSNSKAHFRVNNNRLCPKANDILKQVQTLRQQRGLGKLSIRVLNDEAVVGYYADELAGKTPKPKASAA